MKVSIIYDATPGNLNDPEVKKALDILNDVHDIDRILKRYGHDSSLVGFDFQILDRTKELLHKFPDLVFNLCEGLGDDSSYEVHLASLMELLNIPFTGSSSWTLALCLNKATAKELLCFHEIPTPKHVVIEPGFHIHREGLEFPLIVKPVREDGSFGIDDESVVGSDHKLKKKVEYIHLVFKQAAIVEEYIDGREFNVSILGNDPFLFVQVREIQFLSDKRPRIISFNAKWKTSSPEYNSTPGGAVQDLPDYIQQEIIRSAVQCFKVFKMRDYARIDFRMGKSLIPYVIDINPNPCISRDSGMAGAAEQNGMSYEQFIDKIIQSAHARLKVGENSKS